MTFDPSNVLRSSFIIKLKKVKVINLLLSYLLDTVRTSLANTKHTGHQIIHLGIGWQTDFQSLILCCMVYVGKVENSSVLKKQVIGNKSVHTYLSCLVDICILGDEIFQHIPMSILTGNK